jgi:hypothetical protein
MDVNSLFAAASVIVGIILGFALNLWRDKNSENKEIKQMELRYQREYMEKYIIVPIISEIDDILKLMDKSYITFSSGDKLISIDTINILWENSGTVMARIIALDDDILLKTYSGFSEIVVNYLSDLSKKEPDAKKEAFNQLKVARQKAGIIFDRLKPKLTGN